MGLVAPWHVGSSWTRARTRVPCIGRWILNHCTTRGASIFFLIFIYLAALGLSCGMWDLRCHVRDFHCSMRDLFFLFFSCGMRDLVPWPGIEPGPPALGAGVLTTGPAGKSQQHLLNKVPFFPHQIEISPLLHFKSNLCWYLFLCSLLFHWIFHQFLDHSWKSVGKCQSSGKAHLPHVLSRTWRVSSPDYCIHTARQPLPSIYRIVSVWYAYTYFSALLFSLTASPATQPHHCFAADARTNLITPLIPVYGPWSASSLHLIPVWPCFPFSHPVSCPLTTKTLHQAPPNSGMRRALGFVFCGQFLHLLDLLENWISLVTLLSPPLAQMVTVFSPSLLLPLGQDWPTCFASRKWSFAFPPKLPALNLMLFNRTILADIYGPLVAPSDSLKELVPNSLPFSLIPLQS